MTNARIVATFAGPVRVHSGSGPIVMRITGREPWADGSRTLEVGFCGAAALPALPEALMDAQVDSAAAGAWRIRSGTSEWLVSARSVHVHADPVQAVGAALPPRRVPLRRRAYFTLIMALMRSAAGRGLLVRWQGRSGADSGST